MTAEQWARASQILARLERLKRARKEWTQQHNMVMFANLLALNDPENEEHQRMFSEPDRVFDVGLVDTFRRSALEQMDAEEKALRREFDAL